MPAHKIAPLRRATVPRGDLRSLAALQTSIAAMPPPPTPVGLTKAVREEWTVFWQSPIAAHVIPAHLPALRRLFALRSQRERFALVGFEQPVSFGSTGQQVLNPLLKELDAIDAKILALEDRFGLSPKHSIALSEGLDDATAAAAAANRALSEGFGDPEVVQEPRARVKRVAAIE
jgi:hypothetical protein